MSEEFFKGLYQVFQSQKSVSSGTGGSYWAIAATCGLKSRLFEHYKVLDKEEEYDPQAKTPTGKPKVTGRIAGAFFHGFQQFWRTGKFSSPTTVLVNHEDINFETAANCFQAYRRYFNDDPHNRGQVLDAEVRCPANEQERELIRATLGDMPFSIRHDLRVHIGPELVERMLLNDNIILPGPGDYLVDYKLVQSITADVLDNYRYGYQALSYPVTYNLCHPDTPVRGILYDVMARVKKPGPEHFALVLAEPGPNALDIVRDGVQLAFEQQRAGRANPLICDKTAFGSCRLMTKGQCPRHGKFDDFNWGPELGQWSKK